MLLGYYAVAQVLKIGKLGGWYYIVEQKKTPAVKSYGKFYGFTKVAIAATRGGGGILAFSTRPKTSA